MGKNFQACSLHARSHNLDFLNVSVLSNTVVYSAIPYEKIKAYNYVSEALARFARSPVTRIWFVFMSVHLGACPLPSPPPYQKASYAIYCWQLSLKSGQNEDGRFRPPHSLHEIAATAIDLHASACLHGNENKYEWMNEWIYYPMQ